MSPYTSPPTYPSSHLRLTIGSLMTAIALLAFTLAAFRSSAFLGILNGLLCLLALWRCRRLSKIRCHDGDPNAPAWGRAREFLASYVCAIGLVFVVVAVFWAVSNVGSTPSSPIETIPALLMAGLAGYGFWKLIWPRPPDIIWIGEVIDRDKLARSASAEDDGTPVFHPSAPDSPAPSNAPAVPCDPQNR